MNKVINKVIAVAAVTLSLTLSGFVTDAVGQVLGFHSVKGEGAIADWTFQSGCVRHSFFIEFHDAVDHYSGQVVPPGPPTSVGGLAAVVEDDDTCANQVLQFATGDTPIPPDAVLDRTLTTAKSGRATVELNCTPYGQPLCDLPSSVDIDLTWTGIGAIDRTAIAGNPDIFPGIAVEIHNQVNFVRSATVTGDVSSGGTSWTGGVAPDFAVLSDFSGGDVELNPPR
jgi:hypothetical protein